MSSAGDRPFDDAFVAGAARREPTAYERAEHARRTAAGHARATGWRSATSAPGRPQLRRRRRDGRGRLALLLAAALLGAGWWLGVPLPAGVQAALAHGARSDAPPSPPRQGRERLLPAPPVPGSGEAYAFLETLDDGHSPVAWSPCAPVRLVVRPGGEVAGGPALLAEAVAQVSAATGLQLVDAGATAEAPSDHRPAYQRERYGEGWAPVLVAWSDPQESPELAGDVAGYASPVSYAWPGRARSWVTGTVVLDGPQLAELQASAGPAAVRAVVLHELAHLLGLAHVDDPAQLMHPAGGSGGSAPGSGDLHGLALVGRGACR